MACAVRSGRRALVTGGLPGIVAGSVATRSVPTHVVRILLIGIAAIKLLI
jgi:hypothetical protein